MYAQISFQQSYSHDFSIFYFRHPGSFDIVHVKDSAGHTFATRLPNVFVIGKATKPWVSLPKGKGIKLSILEERSLRNAKGRA